MMGFGRLAELTALATVLCTALCLGGAPTWVLWPMLAGCCATLLLASASARASGSSLRWTGAAFVLLAATVLVGLQLLPLPAALVRLLSPEASELRQFVLAPLGLPTGGPLSQEVPATLREWAKHLGYLALFLGVTQLARSERSRRRLLAGVALAGVVVAAVTLGHAAVGAREYFGLHAFAHGDASVLSPFGNENHLAAFVSVGAILSLGFARSSSGRQRAFLWGLAFVANGAVAVLSLSRGGLAFLGLGLLLFGLWTWRTRAATLIAGVLVLAAVGGYLAWDQLLAEAETVNSLEKLQASKIELWPMFWEAATRYPLGGTGRGAFEAVFTRYQTLLPTVTFTHPENWVLQLCAELGLVPALALILAAALVLVRAFRRTRADVLDLAAWAALASVLLHDLFDFSLEFPPAALAALILAAVVCRPRHGQPRANRALWLRPAFGMGLAVALAAVGATSLLLGRSTLADAEGALAETLAEAQRPGQSGEEALAAALPLIRQHPADYVLLGSVANAFASGPGADARSALFFANLTFFLRPLDAAAHVTAARALVQLGHRGQGMLEYRLAFEAGLRGVLKESAAAARDLRELQALVPAEPKPLRDLAQILWAANRKDLARELLAAATEQFGETPEAAELWILASGDALQVGDQAGAERFARAAVRMAPEEPHAVLALARVLQATKRTDEAVELLEAGVRKNIGHLTLSLEFARALHGAGRGAEAWDTVKRLEPFVDSTSERASILAFEGELYRREHRLFRAVDSYSSAIALAPRNLSFRITLAQLYEALSRPSDALRELHEVVRIRGSELPGEQAWEQRLEEQEKAWEERRRALHLQIPTGLPALDQSPGSDPDKPR